MAVSVFWQVHNSVENGAIMWKIETIQLQQFLSKIFTLGHSPVWKYLLADGLF